MQMSLQYEIGESTVPPREKILRWENWNFFVSFLFPSVIALIQPTDQGVTASMKKKFKTNFLKKKDWRGELFSGLLQRLHESWQHLWRKHRSSSKVLEENTLVQSAAEEEQVSACDLAKFVTGGNYVDVGNIVE